jgi:hypothetical protein
MDMAATTIRPMRHRLVISAVGILLVGCGSSYMGGLDGPPKPPSARQRPGEAVALLDVEDFVARHWRSPLAPQGAPPPRFSTLEASLAPEACGTCHPAQLADWTTSVHAASMGPGVAGQLVEMLDADRSAALACYTCHAPLAEQRPFVPSPAAGAAPSQPFAANPALDRTLQPRGVVCAGCHVRAHERFAPPRRDGTLYSGTRATLAHGGATRTPAFLRSEFCRDCHQFRPDGFALNGTPLQNTYAEWKASPFAAAGVQCQDCHMPDRRHTWRGIHDRAMVISGLTIGVEREPVEGAVAATLRVRNTGVGHAFPTYVTPLVLLRAELIDAAGRVISGSREQHVIGRQIELDLSREISDTRLLPGAAAELRYRRPRRPGTRARFSVLVFPDAFYTAFFEALLRQGAGRGTAAIEEALAATQRSGFTVFTEELDAG